MDNITHTLVGAALAEAGLKKRTALGGITLVLGANFPDVDIVGAFMGRNFEVRRGITHGFLALVVLPFVLAGIVWAWDAYVRRANDPSTERVKFWQLVLLSAVSMATHPMLDFMNTYGMRWLMPFVDKWFYADGLFIVDPWIWLALGTITYYLYRRSKQLSLTETAVVTLPTPVGAAPVEYAGVIVAFEEGTYSQGAIATALKLASHRKADVRVIVTVDVPQHLEIEAPLPEAEATAQAMIDFSIPEAATAVTRLCMDRKIPLVMATTGLTKETKELLAKAAERIPVVYSPSMSTSVGSRSASEAPGSKYRTTSAPTMTRMMACSCSVSGRPAKRARRRARSEPGSLSRRAPTASASGPSCRAIRSGSRGPAPSPPRTPR